MPFKLCDDDGGDDDYGIGSDSCNTVYYLLLLMKVCLLMADLTKLMHLMMYKARQPFDFFSACLLALLIFGP